MMGAVVVPSVLFTTSVLTSPPQLLLSAPLTNNSITTGSLAWPLTLYTNPAGPAWPSLYIVSGRVATPHTHPYMAALTLGTRQVQNFPLPV